jgi:hypothetical protein
VSPLVERRCFDKAPRWRRKRNYLRWISGGNKREIKKIKKIKGGNNLKSK